MSSTASSSGAGAAANAAAAAATPAGPNTSAKAMQGLKSLSIGGWISIGLFVVAIGFLAGNVGLLTKLAGSKDDWDTIKTQMGGSIALSFIGASVFAVALYLFVSQYNLGNLQVPMLISIILSSLSLAIGLSALSVAAITR